MQAVTTPSAIALKSGGSLRVSSKAGRTSFDLRNKAGQKLTLEVRRDDSVAPNALLRDVHVLAEAADGRTLIVTDTYPSTPAGLRRCQAGEEKFLRILSFDRPTPREALQVKLESCLDNIELASTDGLAWQPDVGALRINWLLGPSIRGRPETLDLRISDPATVAPGQPPSTKAP